MPIVVYSTQTGESHLARFAFNRRAPRQSFVSGDKQRNIETMSNSDAAQTALQKAWSAPLVQATLLASLFLFFIGGVIYFKQDLRLTRQGWSKRSASLFYLPSKRVLKSASLGHQTFFADLIWIRALLYAGSHFTEKGSIKWVPRYTDAIVTLDPKFRYPYVWGSILLLYNRWGYTRESVYTSNALLQRAQKQFPYEYYFPYLLAMNYLNEIKLTRRSHKQLKADEYRFCVLPPEKSAKSDADLYAALNVPVWKLWELQRRFTKVRSQRWMKLYRKVKRCLRHRAAMYLMEASTKEDAPPHIAQYGATLLRGGGTSNVVICQHLQELLWRADSDKVRDKIRQKMQRHCSPKVLRALLCQEWLFTNRWKQQKPYISRSLFSLLDLPANLQSNKPLSYPLPSQENLCLKYTR